MKTVPFFNAEGEIQLMKQSMLDAARAEGRDYLDDHDLVRERESEMRKDAEIARKEADDLIASIVAYDADVRREAVEDELVYIQGNKYSHLDELIGYLVVDGHLGIRDIGDLIFDDIENDDQVKSICEHRYDGLPADLSVDDMRKSIKDMAEYFPLLEEDIEGAKMSTKAIGYAWRFHDKI